MGMIITLYEKNSKCFWYFTRQVIFAVLHNIMFCQYISRNPTSNTALDIANENRYRSHMDEHKKLSQQRPDRPAELPRNDKTAMRVTSRTLLGTATELIIQHDGREYRLRVTQNGKLILTA
jgi:hemin uptake protein HemP